MLWLLNVIEAGKEIVLGVLLEYMPDKTDIRYIRVDTAIQTALIQLMQEQPIESITVSDIIVAAKISRGAFYLHYHDINHLLQTMVLASYEDAESVLSPVSLAGGRANIERTIVSFFTKLNENYDLIHALSQIKGIEGTQHTFQRRLWDILVTSEPFLAYAAAHPHMNTGYLLASVCAAIANIVQTWSDRGEKRESPEKIAAILLDIMQV